MSYNLLNYPEPGNAAADTSLRNPYFRTILNNESPDIIVVQEVLSQTGVNGFLNNVLNSSSLNYAAGTFIDGFDSDNAIFYRSSQFSFAGNKRIDTELRDINEFTLIHLSTNDTLRIYSVHLKASNSSADEAQRAREVDSLRKVTDLLPLNSHFIVCGDFNFYRSTEQGYLKLKAATAGKDGHFYDPIIMNGTWNNPAFAQYHTQSPRIRQFGGGTAGGMDDRFDLILYSSQLNDPSGHYYIAGSQRAVGNDGMHYNDSINALPNNAVSPVVANALHNASDHLPVIALFSFETGNIYADIGVKESVLQPDSLCPSDMDEVHVTLENNGSLVHDFALQNVQLTLQLTDPALTVHTANLQLSAGILAQGSEIAVSFPLPFNNPAGGVYSAKCFIDGAADMDHSNDTLIFNIYTQFTQQPAISPQGPLTLCNGTSLTLTCSPATSYLWNTGSSQQSISVVQQGVYSVEITDSNECIAASLPVIVSSPASNNGVLLAESMGVPSSTSSIATYENNNGFDNDDLMMEGTADVRTTASSSGYAGASGGGNVFITNIPGRNFIISNINTSGLDSVQLAFGIHKSTTASTAADFRVSYSTDGINYTDLPYPSLPSGTGTVAWYYRQCLISLPSTPELYIAFTNTGSATQYRVDDIIVTMLENVPHLASFTPLSGQPQDTVFLQGSHLDLVQAVSFNEVPAVFSVVSSNEVISVVPDSASSGYVKITSDGCDTLASANVFTVISQGITLNINIYIEGFYSSGILAMSDTLLVSIHEPAAPYSIIETVASTIDFAGHGIFYFTQAMLNESYYVSFRHRNALETWSKTSLVFDQPVMNFNLTP